ncbi:hypothetical protein IAT38_001489 [Cryptococcus sp. DSM 104549]
MSSVPTAYTKAHRIYVKSLYKRYLTNALDWYIRRDLWRYKALEIRAEFEANRDVTEPRALAVLLENAEKKLAKRIHPDPYRPPTAPGGTKWERNLHPPIFSREDNKAAQEIRDARGPNMRELLAQMTAEAKAEAEEVDQVEVPKSV